MTIQQDPLVGQKIGRYPVAAFLGRGRGAAVYRATDPVIDRVVAIKILDRELSGDGEATARFLRDAAQLAQLRHPHILPIYDVGQHDGRAYLVRQHTDGGTLRDYLREVGTIDLPDALPLFRPIATGLDYAHRQGFVHGNLRPSNIVRTRGGKIFLTDFVVPGQDDESSAATTIVSAIDDPVYASPKGARDGSGGASGDHYVLGVIVFEALTGQPPFQIAEGDTARHVLTRHLQAEPPAPRAINPALGPAVEATLLRALAKRPEERFPTAAAFIYALNEAHALDRDGDRAGERRAARPGSGPLTLPADGLPDPDDVGTSDPDHAALSAAVVEPLAAAVAAPSHLTPRANPSRSAPPTLVVPNLLSGRAQIVAIGLIALLCGLLCGLLLAVW
jgi:serine/threonine-protein kinase